MANRGFYEGIQITGMDDVVKKLQGLESKIVKKHVRKALKAGAGRVQAEAKRIVRRAEPGPTRPKYGHLADKGIVIKPLNKAHLSVATVGVNWQTHSYGHLLEFGHKTPRGKETEKLPFMRTAYESEKDKALDDILTTLRDAVEKEISDGR